MAEFHSMRGTPASREATYEDVVHILTALGREVARQYGIPRAEAESDAFDGFLEAYNTHVSEKGSIEQRIRYIVRKRQAQKYKLLKRRNRILNRKAVDPDHLYSKIQTPVPYSFGRLTGRVGRDARIVLALLYDGPEEFDTLVRNDPKPGEVSIRRHLMSWLRVHHGWNRSRTWAAFREISENI